MSVESLAQCGEGNIDKMLVKSDFDFVPGNNRLRLNSIKTVEGKKTLEVYKSYGARWDDTSIPVVIHGDETYGLWVIYYVELPRDFAKILKRVITLITLFQRHFRTVLYKQRMRRMFVNAITTLQCRMRYKRLRRMGDRFSMAQEAINMIVYGGKGVKIIGPHTIALREVFLLIQVTIRGNPIVVVVLNRSNTKSPYKTEVLVERTTVRMTELTIPDGVFDLIGNAFRSIKLR